MALILRCALLLALCRGMAAAGDSGAPRYEFSEASGLVRLEDGSLRNDGARAAVVVAAPSLADNTRWTLPVILPLGKDVVFATGRGEERLSLKNLEGERVAWDYRGPDGRSAKEDLYFGWSADYYPNGRIQPGFFYDEITERWNRHFLARPRRFPNVEAMNAEWEFSDGRVRVYFDRHLLHEGKTTDDLFDRNFRVTLPPGATLGAATVSDARGNADFLPVDIAGRANIALPPPAPDGAARLVVDGIPFFPPAPGKNGENAVDLGESWFREGNLASYESPHNGSFGGRWTGALGGQPTRMQFRVPYRQYDALYLLASRVDAPDRVPRLTAQFYRPGSGFPKNFTPRAPIAADGQPHVVRIPLTPGPLAEFSDLPVMEVELTGDTHVYRAYPDPAHYSLHAGGFPSGARIHAMTLGVAPFDVSFEPETPGGAWVEPAQPAYRVTLANRTAETRGIPLLFTTESYDGKEVHEFRKTVTLGPRETRATRFDAPLARFGWHRVSLDAGGRTFDSSLARLRRREYRRRPFDAKGFMFGWWNWNGGHLTPANAEAIRLMGRLGLESVSHNSKTLLGDEVAKDAGRFGLRSFWAYAQGTNSRTRLEDLPGFFDRGRLAASDLVDPVYVNIFAEPGGLGTRGTLPEFYGEPEKEFTPEEERQYENLKKHFLAAEKEIRLRTPEAKILMPWGDPVFAVPFLRDPETRGRFDGAAYDAAFFDRLPEEQFHQGSLHRIWQFLEAWKKYRTGAPTLVSVEGPCIGPVAPGSLTETRSAAHMLRASLLLGAYGVNRQFSISGVADTASYWGEQHYGNGAFTRRNTHQPHVAYAALGTLVRHLRHMEFTRWIPTGSLSAYCLEYRDSRDGQSPDKSRLRVLWTVRGERPVTLDFRAAYDAMDNPLTSPLRLGIMPIFVYGGEGDAITLGEPDHGDARAEFSPHHIRLGAAAELFTRQSAEADDEYLNSFPAAIRRFPATMALARTPEGLAVTLPPQEADRGVMPYCTVLHPERPVVLPGRPSHLTLEAAAASDWGRVVYVLRDAKGGKWVSAGTPGTYNNDDTPGASVFNFDGRRLLRFELPGHLDWDRYRTRGTTWWGSSEGDGVVHYPLALEKIILERRAKAMYVNSLEPARPDPVVLGDLHVEYETPEAMTAGPAIRRPAPPEPATPFNPIAELAAQGTLPPTEILRVDEPDHYYDGTRGIFHFREAPDAARYDILLSGSPDGTNAVKLGAGLKGSGQLVRGFKANTTFYAFVVYYDRGGAVSRPSEPFAFRLEDRFGNK